MNSIAVHDVVIIGSARWDGPYSSAAFALAKALSKHTRVFYVDNPITISEYFRNRKSATMKRREQALFYGEDFFSIPEKAGSSLLAVTPRLIFPANWLPKGFLYDAVSGFNNRIVAHSLNRLFRIFRMKKYILINSFNPAFGKVVDRLKIRPSVTVYHSVDDIRFTPYLSKHGVRHENDLVSRVDLTLVTSSRLYEMKKPISLNIRLLPNAADTQLFSQALKKELPIPAEIAKLTPDKKIVCYLGNICQRIDYVLLKKLAAFHHDKVILMVGPMARDYANPDKTYVATSGLNQFSNVIFTGPKPSSELPAFLKHSDCCIIPFLCNDLTKSIYPLKVNEYLSAGKPVVTTPFSDDILKFREVTYISENDSDFIQLIDKAIHENSEIKAVERTVFSASNNWDARARHFIELIVDFLKHHDRGTRKPDRRTGAQALYG
jgi:teichuronic acid biosynthesis glycosyltransferase TuaH